MFVIRKAQFNTLSRSVVECYRQDTLRHLRQHGGQYVEGQEDSQLLSLIDDGVVKAQHYGIDSTTLTTRFIEIMLVVGHDFDAEPWASSILHAPDLLHWQKLELLEDYLRDKV